MSLSSNAIGIFDSGVGGLTVMHQIAQLLPHEQLIYFGDTARIPYGNKSPQTVIKYSIENTLCLIEKNIKLLVVACNTATAMALSKLNELFHIPIVGVIEPGAQKAVSVTRNNHIAVLGTRGTIQSEAYQTAIRNINPDMTITAISCPLFVPLVEEQWFHHPATDLIIREYLEPLTNLAVDTILLGCTHYPLLAPLIQQYLGKNISLVDSATTCASQVAKLLQQHNLLAATRKGEHHFYVSDDLEKFCQLGERLFGYPLKSVEMLSSARE